MYVKIQKIHLSQHLKIHVGERNGRINCELCGMKSTLKELHMKSCLGNPKSLKEKSITKKYDCDKCKMSFKSLVSLATHKSIHNPMQEICKAESQKPRNLTIVGI